MPELTDLDKEMLESIKSKIHLAGLQNPDELETAIANLGNLKSITDIDVLIYPEGYQ
jgi:hypothetical protein